MDPVTGLSLGRIAVGVASLAKPDLTASLMGGGGNAAVTRMFGTREIAVGALTLVSRGAARRRLVVVGIGIDGADVAAGLIGMREGSLDQKAGGALTAVAAGAVLSGVLALVGDRRTRKAEKKAAKAAAKQAKHAKAA